MCDTHNQVAPINLINFLGKTSEIHTHRTRATTNENFYIEYSRIWEIPFQELVHISGMVYPCLSNRLKKAQFKIQIKETLFDILQNDVSYLEIPGNSKIDCETLLLVMSCTITVITI